MSDEKPFGNITVRFEREFLDRFEKMEAVTELNKSEITRRCLAAALRQFERVGKLSFPIEIADISVAMYNKAHEKIGELSGRLGYTEEKLEQHTSRLIQLEKDRLTFEKERVAFMVATRRAVDLIDQLHLDLSDASMEEEVGEVKPLLEKIEERLHDLKEILFNYR